MRLRSQSAMEYLMTYGWSILIISVVVAILFSVGVFNIGNTSSSSDCVAITGWQCNNPTLYGSGTLSFTTGQIGSNIGITGVACTATNTAPTSISLLPATISLGSGQTTILNATCPIASNAIGSKFSGYLWIQYNNQYSSGIITPVGRFISYVRSGGTGPSTVSRIAYVPINVINSNTVAGTGSGFDQMVYFNPTQSAAYTANEAGDLGNIRFYQGSTALYSWCESGCSNSISSNAVFWINIPGGIGANSKIVVNMTFLPVNTEYDDAYAGEAPQLSSTFGQYDNGGSVFSGYSSSNGGTPSQFSAPGFPFVAEIYVLMSGSEDDLYYTPPGTISSSNQKDLASLRGSGANQYFAYSLWGSCGGSCVTAAPVTYTVTTGTYYINELNVQSSTSFSEDVNYNNQFSSLTGQLTTSGGLVQGATTGNWMRTRAYPPGGVMPTTSFGAISH